MLWSVNNYIKGSVPQTLRIPDEVSFSSCQKLESFKIIITIIIFITLGAKLQNIIV